MRLLPLAVLTLCAALARASAAADPIHRCETGKYDSPEGYGCLECPEHYYCLHDRKLRCPTGSDTQTKGRWYCAVQAGYYWLWDANHNGGSVQPCERDHYCLGGYNDMWKCPAGTHCGRGCRAKQQCQ